MATAFQSNGQLAYHDDDLIGATYARISTAKQKDGISLHDQDTRMAFYAHQNTIAVPDEYRFKEQESGFKEERSEYDKIRQLVRERRIQVLIVYGSDRHTRDPIHGDIFRAELRRNNVSLHIITEGGEVDIISPTGQFIRRQMDNFNWYWGKMVQQTTQEKKRAYTEQDIPYQQGTARYGYRRVGKQSNAHLDIVEDLCPTIEKIFTWFDTGEGPRDIARMLHGTPTPGDLRNHKTKLREWGVWTEDMVYEMLNDEIYAGVYYAYRFKIVEDEFGNKKRIRAPKSEWKPIAVPAIISRELWERCQARLEKGRVNARHPHAKYPYLLARLSSCRMLRADEQPCGYSVLGATPSHRPKWSAYYICNARQHKLFGGRCTLPYFQVKEADEEVWKFTKALLSDSQAMLATVREAQAELRQQQAMLYQKIAELEDLIAEHTHDLDGLVRDYRKLRKEREHKQHTGADLLLETLQRQAEEIEETITGLTAQKAKLQVQLDQRTITDAEIAALEQFAEEVRPRLPHATFADKREIIEALKFTFEFSCEEAKRVIYVMWHTYEFPLVIGEDLESSPKFWRRACG
jgi:site-specific DNA recombinase